MLVSHGPWWWIRVLPPGAVVTIDEYRLVEPATGAETAIARSMSGFWPVPTTNSDGPIRFAIRPMIPAARYDPADARRSPRPPRPAAGRAPRRPDAAPVPAAVRGGPRRPGRGLDQARGPGPARVLGQQIAEPRVPARRRAGRGRRHGRDVRPALVQPLPAHGRRRCEA